MNEKTEKLDFYKDLLLEKRTTGKNKIIYKRINDTDVKSINEIMDFCINHIKDNIIYLNNNKQPINGILRELFLRGLAKWHIKKIK